MKYWKQILIILSICLTCMIALTSLLCAAMWISLHFFDGNQAPPLSGQEHQLRQDMVREAQQWLGTGEGTDGHTEIISIYNTHEPLAQGYEVKSADNWCAAFGSAVAIRCGRTDIVPTECGCERQIGLWKQMNRWEETDSYRPLPGDYIYYNWDADWDPKDNTGWADHVGIVVGTAGPAIKVIEGNRDDCVMYRVIFRWDHRIRGYGLPDYASIQ